MSTPNSNADDIGHQFNAAFNEAIGQRMLAQLNRELMAYVRRQQRRKQAGKPKP
jgi:hypothetical protein